jgi:ABC-type transport system involved in multi-copper enzyme maturation permease subunit
MFAAMIGRSISRMRGALAGTAGLVALFQIIIVLQAASIDRTQRYEMLGEMTPAFIQRWLGESLAALASFGGLVTVGYFHPVIMLLVSMVAAYAASELAGDSENGHVDLLLSRPVARSWVVTRSAVVVLACPLGLAALMLLSTWLSLALVSSPASRPPSAASLLNLAGHLVAVAWCFGALALALASVARRRGGAIVPTAIAAVALYLNNVLAASWAPSRVLDVLSPFHYYQGPAVLAGLANSTLDFLVLGVGTVGFLAVAYWRYSRRDL